MTLFKGRLLRLLLGPRVQLVQQVPLAPQDLKDLQGSRACQDETARKASKASRGILGLKEMQGKGGLQV